MNKFCKIAFLITTIFLLSCQDTQTLTKDTKCFGSYELIGPASKDTVNVIDCNKKKQGHWVVTKNIIPKFSVLPSDNKKALQGKIIQRIIEEGVYNDDKKEGYWRYFNEDDGSLKDSVLYKNGEEVKN